MAQQTKSKSGRTSNASRSSARKSAANGRAAAKPRSSARRSQSRSSSRGTAGSRASSGRSTSTSSTSKGTVSAAKDTTVNRAKTLASAAKQFKTPAIATGVGLVGLAGGMALGRSKDRKSLGMPLRGRSAARVTSKKLSGAAKDIGAVAEQTGQIAERVRLVSEAIGGKDTAPRRSPIEVVLEGLTRRSTAAPRGGGH
jgi:hypothetical protein